MTGCLNKCYLEGGANSRGELHLMKEQALICSRKGCFEICGLHNDLGFICT